MLPENVKKTVSDEILRMESEGYSDQEIDDFVLAVTKKYQSSPEKPSQQTSDVKPVPSIASTVFPSAVNDLNRDRKKTVTIRDMDGNEFGNVEVNESPNPVMVGFNALSDLVGIPKRVIANYNDKRSVREVMSDPSSTPFQRKYDENVEAFESGTSPGKWIDLAQAIGYDALGDPLSYVGLGLPAKIANAANLVNKSAKVTGVGIKGAAKAISGIDGQVMSVDDVLAHAAQKGIKDIESAEPLSKIQFDLSTLKDKSNEGLKSILEATKDDLAHKARVSEVAANQIKQNKLDQLREVNQGAKDKLLSEIPDALSRDSRKTVFSKYDAITEPIENKVSIDFRNQPGHPFTIIDEAMQYGKPEFNASLAEMKKKIEGRLFDTDVFRQTGSEIVPGSQVLKEKKLYQELADGTFGEFTDAEKTLYKRLARTYREKLESEASKISPDYVNAMREKANDARVIEDAGEFMPKNISSDLNVQAKVRSTVDRLSNQPELIEKLRRLDEVLKKGGFETNLSRSANEFVQSKKAIESIKQIGGSEAAEALERLGKIDPEFVSNYVRDVYNSNLYGKMSKDVSKAGDIGKLKMSGLEAINPAKFNEISDAMKKADASDIPNLLGRIGSQKEKELAMRDLKILDETFGTDFEKRIEDARVLAELGGGNSGKVKWWGRRENTGVNVPMAIIGASAGGAVGGAGAPLGVALSQILQSPRGAVHAYQFANGLDKLTTGKTLDKLIAAAEIGNSKAVLDYLSKNGLKAEEEKKIPNLKSENKKQKYNLPFILGVSPASRSTDTTGANNETD